MGDSGAGSSAKIGIKASGQSGSKANIIASNKATTTVIPRDKLRPSQPLDGSNEGRRWDWEDVDVDVVGLYFCD